MAVVPQKGKGNLGRTREFPFPGAVLPNFLNRALLVIGCISIRPICCAGRQKHGVVDCRLEAAGHLPLVEAEEVPAEPVHLVLFDVPGPAYGVSVLLVSSVSTSYDPSGR